MPFPDGLLLKEKEGACLLPLKVNPRASKSALGGVEGGELKVRLAAPPVDGKANEEVVRFFSRLLGCSKGALRILKGLQSRHKVLAVEGLQAGQVLDALRKYQTSKG